tara:strand:- start:2780 stop:3271 length:492 start_codon:yes stop_codon:yes gene_type:complete
MKKKFNMTQMPQAYFSGNINAEKNRKQLIKNMFRQPECDIDRLTDVFFSFENIEMINKQLILTVYKKSKNLYKIPFQKRDDLIVVMRYVYDKDARHLPFKIKEQIRQLNCSVIKEILPNIFTQIEQNITYLKNLGKPLNPLPLPINVNKLNKTLPSISSIYHN